MKRRAPGPPVLLGYDPRRRRHRVRHALLGPRSLFRSVTAMVIALCLFTAWGAGFAYVVAVLN